MDREVDRKQWAKMFKAALEAEGWGDVEEASEHYKSLHTVLTSDTIKSLGVDEQHVLHKIVACLESRMNAIADTGPDAHSLDAVAMKKLTKVFEDLTAGVSINSFPVDIGGPAISSRQRMASGDGTANDPDDGPLVKTSSREGPKASASATTVLIQVEKIGLKDAQNYIQPFLKISVVDHSGRVIEEVQDVKALPNPKPTHVMFDKTVDLKTPVDKIGAIFFEFMHFKPKKQKQSTRCYTFMEPQEIKAHNRKPACLEIYKKPTDFSRKRVNLFTIKSLYLHVTVSIMQE